MQAATLSRPIPLSSPWPLRWVHAVQEVLRMGLARWGRRSSAASGKVTEWGIEDLAALNDDILRDIGVPDWLREEAAVRRESEQAVADRFAAAGGLYDRRW